MPPKRKAAAKGSKSKAAAASTAANEESATDTSVLDASTVSELDTSTVSTSQDAVPVAEPEALTVDAPVIVDSTEPGQVSEEAAQGNAVTTQHAEADHVEQLDVVEEAHATDALVEADQNANVEQSTTPTIEPTDGQSSSDDESEDDDGQPRSKRAKGDDGKERPAEAVGPDFSVETELKPEPEPLPDKDQLIQQTIDDFHLGATIILSNLPTLDAVEGKTTEELYLEALGAFLSESGVQPTTSVFSENRKCRMIPHMVIANRPDQL